MENIAKVFIKGKRNGYDTAQCGHTLTVGELIELLQDFDENSPVYLNNDNGYTYGSITYGDITEEDTEEYEEE
jgi:hypothetical protein